MGKFIEESKYELQEELHSKASNMTGIPLHIKEKHERNTGIPLDDVRVHYNSSEPQKYGALAYVLDDDIYIQPGQEQYLEHELGHYELDVMGQVQANGRAEDGTPICQDASLEQKADEMGQSPLSEDMFGRRRDGMRSHAIQRMVGFEFQTVGGNEVYVAKQQLTSAQVNDDGTLKENVQIDVEHPEHDGSGINEWIKEPWIKFENDGESLEYTTMPFPEYSLSKPKNKNRTLELELNTTKVKKYAHKIGTFHREMVQRTRSREVNEWKEAPKDTKLIYKHQKKDKEVESKITYFSYKKIGEKWYFISHTGSLENIHPQATAGIRLDKLETLFGVVANEDGIDFGGSFTNGKYKTDQKVIMEKIHKEVTNLQGLGNEGRVLAMFLAEMIQMHELYVQKRFKGIQKTKEEKDRQESYEGLNFVQQKEYEPLNMKSLLPIMPRTPLKSLYNKLKPIEKRIFQGMQNINETSNLNSKNLLKYITGKTVVQNIDQIIVKRQADTKEDDVVTLKVWLDAMNGDGDAERKNMGEFHGLEDIGRLDPYGQLSNETDIFSPDGADGMIVELRGLERGLAAKELPNFVEVVVKKIFDINYGNKKKYLEAEIRGELRENEQKSIQSNTSVRPVIVQPRIVQPRIVQPVVRQSVLSNIQRRGTQRNLTSTNPPRRGRNRHDADSLSRLPPL